MQPQLITTVPSPRFTSIEPWCSHSDPAEPQPSLHRPCPFTGQVPGVQPGPPRSPQAHIQGDARRHRWAPEKADRISPGGRFFRRPASLQWPCRWRRIARSVRAEGLRRSSAARERQALPSPSSFTSSSARTRPSRWQSRGPPPPGCPCRGCGSARPDAAKAWRCWDQAAVAAAVRQVGGRPGRGRPRAPLRA